LTFCHILKIIPFDVSRDLFIETLSVSSPNNIDELANILDSHFIPIPGQSLIVLPEYFIDGQELYKGRPLNDPMVTALANYAKEKESHVVSGLVEKTENDVKHITGLVISPTRGIVGIRRKQTPTPFESQSGIESGSEDINTVQLDSGLGRLAVAMCFEVFTQDAKLDKVSMDIDILVNPRGFDLDDPEFGELSEKWLLRNRNLAMMGKFCVVGATGSMGKPGPMAEIVDFEGNVVGVTLKPNQVVRGTLDLDLQEDYIAGRFVSKTVPIF